MINCFWFRSCKSCGLFLFLSFLTVGVHGQNLLDDVALTARASASWMVFENQHNSAFNYAPSNTLGIHLGISKNFGKWGWEAGIGIDRMSFVQRSDQLFDQPVGERISVGMKYLSFQIPLHVLYAVTSKIHATAGLNLMGIYLDSYSISTYSQRAGATGLST